VRRRYTTQRYHYFIVNYFLIYNCVIILKNKSPYFVIENTNDSTFPSLYLSLYSIFDLLLKKMSAFPP
jgi:hypothetical protein